MLERAAHPLRKLLQGARPSRAIPVHVMARVISAHTLSAGDIWHLECVSSDAKYRHYSLLQTAFNGTMEIQNCAFGDAKFELDAEGVALMVFGSICPTRKT